MKAVLVANADGKRLYYIVDADTRTNDGVIASNVNDAELVDFWPTVKAAESLIPITNTEFHRFLWSEGKGQDAGYWHSCFIAKRLSIKEELLDSVVIRTDIFNKRIKFNELTNRAMEFKSNMFSPGEKGILKRLGARLSGNLNQATGGVRGFKLGEVFDPKAIDADGDGFVQEGTQFARVAVPGVNTDLPDAQISEATSTVESQKKNSLRSRISTTLKSTVTGFSFFEPGSKEDRSTRWIDRSATVLDNEFDLQEKNLVDNFNNGNKISTVGDAKNVLRQLAPNTIIEFLENKPDSEVLKPYDSELFLGIAHGLFVAPHLKDVQMTVKATPTEYEVDNRGRRKIKHSAQGSQSLMAGIFVGQGDRFYFPSRSGGRQTMDHHHTIMHIEEEAALNQVRPGRFNPRNQSQWQPGTFETLSYDMTGFKIAAAYLFDDASDPDYKKYISLSKKISERMSKGQSEGESIKTLSEQLQDEYSMLKNIYEKRMEDLQKTDPVSLESRIEKAQFRMMRSVMVHELGHAAHQEQAYQDALSAAKKLKDRHIAEYASLNRRLTEIQDLINSKKLEKIEEEKLLGEAAQINEKLNSSIMTSISDLSQLSLMRDAELLPFYVHHVLHGEGDPVKERKIAQDILDRNTARAIADLLSTQHGSFAGDDIIPDSWLDNALTELMELEKNDYRNAVANGDIAEMTRARQQYEGIEQLLKDIKQKGIERMSDPLLDKNGNKIKMTPQMAATLLNLRSQTSGSRGMDQFVLAQMSASNTRPGEDMKVKDLLDFISLGILHVNKKSIKGEIDPDFWLARAEEYPLTGQPGYADVWTAGMGGMLSNNFSALSDVAPTEVRKTMAEAARRLGAAHFNESVDSVSIMHDTQKRIETMLDTIGITDDNFGVKISDPLDEIDGAKRLIDSTIKESVKQVRDQFEQEGSSKQSYMLGAVFALAAIHRFTFDSLSDEERAIAENISKFGGGTPFASYMSLVANRPFATLMRQTWGDNRPELFSELAMINAYRMTLYSGAKDSSGRVFSRQLTKQEIEIMKKLLSWYQPKAEFHLGSTPLQGDR